MNIGRALAALVFGMIVLYHAINLYGLPSRLMSPRIAPWSAAATCLVLALSVFALFAPWPQGGDTSWAIWAVGGLALLLTAPFTFLQKTFGNSDLANIISAIQENKAGDLAEVAAADLRADLIELVVALALAVSTLAVLLLSLPGFGAVLVLLSMAAIVTSRPAAYMFRLLVPDPAAKLVTLDRDFHPPVLLARPAKLPNLVLIYLESLERSYRDHPVTADPFARMAEFEDRNFSVRRLGQVGGMHYSAAGLVSTQSGIPLFPRGIVDAKVVRKSDGTAGAALSRFLPGVSCLGDILAAEGYAGTYLNGSDVEIFSIGDFMRSHGYSKVVGLKPKRDERKVPGQNSWGVPDATLFAEAKAELARLAASGNPFFLSLLTASTHGPNGYPEPGCSYVPPVLPAVKHSLLPAAIRCSIDQTLDFVDEIDRLGIADNTVVVITNDHLAMPNTLWKELRQVGDRRSGLLVIKGSDAAPAATICDRPATHLDTFPTILEAMGYKLRNGRANLGVSLLSGQPTLAETLGYSLLDRALGSNRDIRAHVWVESTE
ncbi:MAG: sulfatase-like hydrolase/transferase [Tabrizicola sp.]|nr:sulfatase-like hydrolase/transferase [Tabrizicola sp.]